MSGTGNGPCPAATNARLFPRRAAIENWNGASRNAVSSPDPKPNSTVSLEGIAAIFATDISAVESSGIEYWNGTSWSLVNTPIGVFGLDAVTALGDGTVMIVGTSGAVLAN